MSDYIALYRKWRPRTFSDVVGQEHITDVLRGEIAHGSVSHAYLFCGSRGTGKTTCAKILARAVSCLDNKGGDPCGECEMCKRSAESFDIAEIDAASNNGVDNIRELREEVLYPPSELKRRVYIIDEVHMLSPGAFNALLKTLEEPPAHALFILATTELNKIPATILSRCKRFDFHRITPENICARLKFICAEEKIPMSDGALMLISRLASGAMRDALSMLELFVGAKEQVTEEECARRLGVIGRGPVMKLLGTISRNDTAGALSVIAEAYAGSKDMGILLAECADAVRDILVTKYVSSPEGFVEGSKETLDELREMASAFTKERLIFSMEILDDAQNRMTRTSFSRRAILEACVIRLCDVNLWSLPESLVTRVSELEAKVRSGGFVQGTPPPQPTFEEIPQTPDEPPKTEFYSSKEEEITPPVTEEIAPPTPAPKKPEKEQAPQVQVSDDEPEVLSATPEILELIKSRDKLLSSLISSACFLKKDDKTVIAKVPAYAYALLKNGNKVDVIRDSICQVLGQVDVRIAQLDGEQGETWDL